MAITLSRYLKLKLDSNLTANAKYNLERIDALGSTFVIDSTNQLNVRSETNIVIEPNSPDVGGTGVGGDVTVGTSAHTIDSLTVYSDSFEISSALTFSAGDLIVTGSLALTVPSPLDLTLPSDYGTSGQVLATDGTGVLSWVNQSGGGGGGSSASTDWLAADGTTKSFSHSLGTTDISIAVHDISSGECILIDTVTLTGLNSVSLTASEPPSVSWRVTVQS